MLHTELLKRSLPPGAYDINAPVISAELGAEGNALDAAQAAAELLLSEADPRTTLHMLPDWERALGLPDPCIGLQPTIGQRRAAVVAKVTQHANLSRAFFIKLAATLGYTITITEFRRHSVISDVNASITDSNWLFTWRVNAALNNTYAFTVLSAINESLSGTGNEILECVIRKYKPAHTHVQFAYS